MDKLVLADTKTIIMQKAIVYNGGIQNSVTSSFESDSVQWQQKQISCSGTVYEVTVRKGKN